MMRFVLPRHLRSPTAAFIHDLLVTLIAWLAAYWLRFNLETVPAPFLRTALEMLPAVIVVQGCVYWMFGLYRGVWRFASMPDLIRIAKAVAVGTASCALAVFLLTRMELVPRSVFPLYAMLLFVLLGGDRFIYRTLKDQRFGYVGGQRVLIAGCGQAAEQLVRELLAQRPREFLPVAYADDNPGKRGREIHGLRVAGALQDIPALVTALQIDIILIAIPSLSSAEMRHLVSICESTRIPFRTLPRVQDIVAGQVTTQTLRPVSIEDLLGREPVELSWHRMREQLAGKVVAVTGGGGSIGSELCRQLAGVGPRRLVVVDNSEFNLYRVTMELARSHPQLECVAMLTDVSDASAIDNAMQMHRPHFVFHAAAFKHVPLLEHQVCSAVGNNVFGTLNTARAAAMAGAEKFVLISTDKAVNPTSVMGATKRIAEQICQAMNGQSRTAFVTVRFGNVLDSAGSVVPLFRQQIAAGGPVTVTHPEVTRFFMTITEATQLIIEAATSGFNGDTFVLDMGDPIPIQYLAEQMIRLTLADRADEVRVVHVGLRPGEKLHEELFYATEARIKTDNSKLMLSRGRKVDSVSLLAAVNELKPALDMRDEDRLLRQLKRMVPEFVQPAAAIPAAPPLAPVVSLENARK
ncbi:MAG: polysaccharide biosynthesis protein [Gammaproteobacteria bacterium]|nr:polysaccharide biosynthesis protein [Gammaproteobacteria bacterium]